jgi:ABC-2 type transport system permease protein
LKFVPVWVNRMKIMLSDRLFVIAMLVIPLLTAMVMGYAQQKEKLGYVPVAVVDEDGSAMSETLIERFSDVRGIEVFDCSREEAMALLNDQKAEAAMIILEGFEEGVETGDSADTVEIVKSPYSVSADMIEEIAAAEIIRLRAPEFAYQWIRKSYKENGVDAGDVKRRDVRDIAESYWEPDPPMTIRYEEVKGSQASREEVTIPPFAAASSGILVMFVMLALLFGSGWVCEERSNGTMSRIISSPGALLPVFMGNASALFVFGLFQTIIFAVAQKVLFDVAMLTGLFAWLVMAAYILCAASLSMFMASLFKTAAQLQAVAPVFAVITGFMGGCLWNYVGMPSELEPISRLTPQGWALSAVTALYADTGRAAFALPSIAVLIIVSAVLFMMSFALLRSRKTTS